MRNIRKLTERAKSTGTTLAGWLNDAKIAAPVRERVESIARDLAALVVSAYVQDWGKPSEFRYFSQEVYLRVADALETYKFVPYVYANPIKGKTTEFSVQLVPKIWISSEEMTRERRMGRVMEKPDLALVMRGPEGWQEAWMALYLANIVSAGEMDRMRQCSCGKWFFALDIRKRTCSDSCHQREWKEAHYAAMTDEEKLKEKEKEKKQNSKHQAAYRERTFGLPKKAKSGGNHAKS
jgi:hypothetical protein